MRQSQDSFRHSDSGVPVLTVFTASSHPPARGGRLSLNWQKDPLFSEKKERVKEDVHVIVGEFGDGQGK